MEQPQVYIYVLQQFPVYLQSRKQSGQSATKMDKPNQLEAPYSVLASSPSMHDKNIEISMRTSCPNENYGNFTMPSQASIQKENKIYIVDNRRSSKYLADVDGKGNGQGTEYSFKIQMVDGSERTTFGIQTETETEKKGFRRDKIVFRTFGAASDQDEDDVLLSKDGNQGRENQLKQHGQFQRRLQPSNEKRSKQQMKKKQISKKQPHLTFLSPQSKDMKNANNKKNNETQCYFEVTNKRWDRVILKITKTKVTVGPVCIDMDKVMKIKIFPSQICPETQTDYHTHTHIQSVTGLRDSHDLPKANVKVMKQNVIKLKTVENTAFHFGQRYPVIILAEPKEMYSESTIPTPESPTYGPGCRLPLPFLSFAKITLKKLKQLYPSIKSTQWQLPEFPLRAVIKKSSKFVVSLPAPFARYNMKNFAFIHGTIYKKSQHKSKWQKRYIIINETGIYSYKDEKDEIYSYSIQAKTIKYIWTWFTILRVDKKQDTNWANIEVEEQEQQQEQDRHDFGKKMANQLKLKKNQTKDEDQQSKPYINSKKSITDNQNAYLIIKIKHGFNGQTEFGIPVCGFDNQINKSKNWLFAFYKILAQYQY